MSSEGLSSSFSFPNNASSSAGSEVPTTSLSQKKLLEEFAIRQKANSLTLSVPTDDRIVRLSLRYYGDPITLFGEGPYERRERLRLFVARKVVQEGETTVYFPELHTPPVTTSSAPDNETFFTEGTPDLLQKRREMCQVSLVAAKKRVLLMRHIQSSISKNEYEEALTKYHKHLSSNLVLTSSQVADDRPLADGCFSPNGDRYSSVGWTGLIKIWSIPSCNHIKTLRGHTDRVYGITWKEAPLNSNCDFASAGADGTVLLWNTQKAISSSNQNFNQHQPSENYDDQNMDEDETQNYNSTNPTNNISNDSSNFTNFSSKLIKPLITSSTHPIASLRGHEARANRVAFHPTHNSLLASSSHDETWRLWDIEKETELLFQEGHNKPILPIKFHPDGSLLMSGDLSGRVVFWDIRIGKVVLQYKEHSKLVFCVDFDPLFPHHCVSGSDDHTAKVWDLRSKKSIKHILSHQKLVTSTIFEPRYSRYLLTASYDSTVRFWSSTDFNLIHELPPQESRVMSASLSHDGSRLSLCGFDRIWKLWELKEPYTQEILNDVLN